MGQDQSGPQARWLLLLSFAEGPSSGSGVGCGPTAVGCGPTAVGCDPTAVSCGPTAVSCSSRFVSVGAPAGPQTTRAGGIRDPPPGHGASLRPRRARCAGHPKRSTGGRAGRLTAEGFVVGDAVGVPGRYTFVRNSILASPRVKNVVRKKLVFPGVEPERSSQHLHAGCSTG